MTGEKTTVYGCSVIELKKNHREKGNLTVVQNNIEVPFEVKRCYYLYDVPGGEERGGHAHKELHQLIVAASGSFDVILNDGNIFAEQTLLRAVGRSRHLARTEQFFKRFRLPRTRLRSL